MKLKLGDKVRLNSGGPAMTVIKLGLFSGNARCAWFDDGDQCHEADFPSESLACFRPATATDLKAVS